MFTLIIVLIVIAFMLPIAINMVSIIKINYNETLDAEEQRLNKNRVKRKIQKVVILFFLFLLAMFVAFLSNYLLSKRS